MWVSVDYNYSFGMKKHHVFHGKRDPKLNSQLEETSHTIYK